jgi:PAS domain S-box-containing protein
MDPTLRILHLEDDAADAELVAATLAAAGVACECVRVTSRAQFLAAMDGAFDLILSDYSLPGFDGAAAQSIARERRPDVPFVFVSGTIGEHAAIEGMKAGATDYVLKHNLERLPAAVRRAVREAGDRRERRNAELEVQRLNAELEQRVIRRTEQLARANRQLEIREEQLRDAKAFLEHLVSASPSIIFRLDPRDLRMTYVSPNVGWLLGYSIEEVTGTPDFWEQLVHPDDRPRVIGRLRAALDETVAQIEQEYRFRSKDGRYRWFFNLLRIEYDAETTPIAVLGYALDIADRKAAEAEVERAHNFLDSVVENLPVMVFVKDAADLRFIRLNRAGEQLLAINRSELIGRTSGEVFPPQLAEAFEKTDRQVLAGRDVVDIPEEIIATPGRGPRVLHTRKIPIHSGGVARYLLGIAEDITERKTAEEQARLSKLEAERASRAKSEFLSRMSHDLRTPLNAVLGFAQLLEMDAANAQQLEAARQILNGGRHLLALINEVLDIARIESGRLALSPEPVSVADIAQQVIDLVGPLAVPRHISVVAELGGARPYVRADLQRLNQVLLNLLGNAVKYNRDGGSVRVSVESRPAGRLAITVADTGPGIPAKMLPVIFEPFERLGAEATSVEGTGLGLTVAKALAEAMDGTLGVRSEVGVGSTFWIDLPAAAAPVSTHHAVTLDSARAREEAVAGTVLYVEDNPSNIRLMQRLLTKRPGVRLMTAGTGTAGLQCARTAIPDLILLDLHLPDMGGEEVMLRLASEPATRRIPIAVLSADATEHQSRRLRAAGAIEYLTKPLEVARVLHLIDAQLSLSVDRAEGQR